MAGSQLEIERKLDVDAGFVLPDLTGVDGVASADAPVEHPLEAVYHDTADLRLLRARVTLRRRTGGADAGWHLKLPASAGARREVHEPLGRAVKAPPRALRELVLGLTRGEPTTAVATLRTRRVATVVRDAEGRALAEVADDTVSATVPAIAPGEPTEQHTWREVEVELVDGDEALLARLCDRLLAAGARPAAAASKVGRVLGSRLPSPPAADPGADERRRTKGGKRGPAAAPVVLAAIAGQVEALQAADLMVRTGQPDAVHKFRVACRRLRSILAAFRPVLDRAATDAVRAELRWLAAELSDARDDEIALAALQDLVAAQPPELLPGPVAARLQQRRLQAGQRGGQEALATLRDPRYLRVLDALDGLLAQPPLADAAGAPAEDVLRDGLRRTARRFRQRVDAARAAAPEDGAHALHEVRKAGKRLRYTGEVAATVLGRRADAVVGCMTEVQDVLGESQDTEVTRAWCERLAREAFAAGENPFAFGRLHALEEARAERAQAAFWALEPTVHPVLRKARKKG